MSSTRLPARWFCASIVAACCACSAESRLWRLSPFSGSSEKSTDRMNLWPLAYSSGSGTSILWPLMDFDSHGFAVRPLVSRNDADWDVLFPLSHWNSGTGDGWALTGYKFGDDVGLFPLFNFGPSFNYFIPAWWNRDGGKVTSYGLFPAAAVTDEFGYVGLAWWTGGKSGDSFGLFPLFTWGPLKWIGPVWWNDTGVESADAEGGSHVAAGLFPLVWKWGDPTRLLVLPLYYGDSERTVVFPLYYGDATRRAVFPLYYGSHGDDGDLHALLLPPTWWETKLDEQNHVVFPFYGHFAHENYDLTAWFPFYASKTTPGRSHWFSLIGDGWKDADSEGLNFYPLWYSARGSDWSRKMLLPFYLYRERGDDRLLLTPLGGRGWDAGGKSRFLNVLGPVYHHSESEGTETTAIAWPFYERDRTGDTTTTSSYPFFGSTTTPAGSDTWFAAGLGRNVSSGEEHSFRFAPLYAQSNAKEAPDLLWDFSLVGFSSHQGPTPQGGAWSAHVFPLYWGNGDAATDHHDSWLLAGVSRYVADGDEHSFRLFPLYSQSSAARTPDPFFDFTLAGFTSNGSGWSSRLLPLYWGRGDGVSASHTTLLGLGHVGTTEKGSSWRLWPLASASNDPAADGLVDSASLFRHERTDSGSRDWLLPLYYTSSHGDDFDLEVVPPLFHHETTGQGSAWRLWPLVTNTNADGLNGWLDPFTLVAHHDHAEKTHVHVGTDAIFGLDRSGEGKRSWNARLLTFCEFGHDERTLAAAQSELEERSLAVTTDNQPLANQRVTLTRNHAGFLFDWFLVENRVTVDPAGAEHDESHYRLPLLHEYRSTPDKKEWDLLCWAVHSKETKDQGTFSVLGYGYRSERKGDSVKRDVFPFVTWDTAPDATHVSFIWRRLFNYERKGDRTGGHVLFIPWGQTD